MKKQYEENRDHAHGQREQHLAERDRLIVDFAAILDPIAEGQWDGLNLLIYCPQNLGAIMSWLCKTADGESPDAIPTHNPRNLPLRRNVGHGTKRDSLPSQGRSDIRIAHVVEALPLIGINPEQYIHLPVPLPKRRHTSPRQSP